MPNGHFHAIPSGTFICVMRYFYIANLIAIDMLEMQAWLQKLFCQMWFTLSDVLSYIEINSCR